MSEITNYQSGGQMAAPDPMQNHTIMSLASWNQELQAAFALAERVCQTPFAPQHFRGKPADAAVAMLYGQSLKFDPLAALKSIYIVHGTPALYAQAMYAIALREGHQIERVHATEQSVKFRARRRGEQTWQEVEWTIERAKRAKYTSNSKYLENPVGMLTEKCKAEAARLVAADALAGMPAAEEVELGDYDEPAQAPEPGPAVESKPRTVKRSTPPRAKKQPAPEAPDVSDAPDPEPADAPETGADDTETNDDDFVRSSRDQWQRLDAALVAQGLEDRGAKSTAVQAWVSEQGITRTVESIAGLSSDEIEAFIAELEADAQQDGDGAETLDWDTAPVGE